MFVSFSRFLMALAVIGLGFGAVFGAGVAVGKGQAPKAAVVNTSGATGAAAAGAGAGTGAAGGVGGGFGGGAGGGAVTGSVDTVSATSMTVKTTAGDSVTLALNPQTTVRKLDDGTVSDIKQGAQVLVQRDTTTSTATSVQLLPAGGLGGARGGASASGTPSASGTAGAGQRQRGAGATATP